MKPVYWCIGWTMAGAIDQIEHDLALLAQSLEAIAQEFQTLYGHYLTEFGKATRQQLVMTSFHVCTHGYPERFLQLSLHQRQVLQQGLRELANQAQMQLSQLLDTSAAIASGNQLDLDDDEAMLGDESDVSANDSSHDNSGTSDSATHVIVSPSDPVFSQFSNAPHQVVVPLADSEQPQFDPSYYLSVNDALTIDASMPEPPTASSDPVSPPAPPPANAESSAESSDDLDSPDDLSELSEHDLNHLNELSTEEGDRLFEPGTLLDQQDLIEEGIAEILRNISHSANRLIQQSGVLPKKLPETVLEAAAKADLSTEAAGPPNLLNLIIETGDEDDDYSRITYIMAIRLRVSEIEFSNPALSAWRAKLREFSARLNRLDQEFEKKQRERASAEAESVWRSSWYDG